MHALMRLAIRIIVPRHRIGAVVVLVDEHRRVLLLRHVFHPDKPWGLPGGWVNRGETPQAAARRELREETGLEAEIGPVLLMEREPRPWHLSIAFAGRLTSEQPEHLQVSSEIHEARWLAEDELPEDLFSFVREAISIAMVRASGGP
jgi:ADP-ribose pyrophosphatase YjhB (NUDIX family)